MRGWVALAASGLAASCGFATRTQNFDCDDSGDCPDDRTCVSGWCVTAAGLPDASDQPAIQCEPDQPCVIDCSQPGSCSGGVDCGDASACTVICSGEGSCLGHIECGFGPCSVECSGLFSCAGSIDCNDACACDVVCSGDASCQSEVDCPHTGQCRDGKECNSTAAGACDSC